MAKSETGEDGGTNTVLAGLDETNSGADISLKVNKEINEKKKEKEKGKKREREKKNLLLSLSIVSIHLNHIHNMSFFLVFHHALRAKQSGVHFFVVFFDSLALSGGDTEGEDGDTLFTYLFVFFGLKEVEIGKSKTTEEKEKKKEKKQ